MVPNVWLDKWAEKEKEVVAIEKAAGVKLPEMNSTFLGLGKPTSSDLRARMIRAKQIKWCLDNKSGWKGKKRLKIIFNSPTAANESFWLWSARLIGRQTHHKMKDMAIGWGLSIGEVYGPRCP